MHQSGIKNPLLNIVFFTAAVFYLWLMHFSIGKHSFCDEVDNIVTGRLMTTGKVVYRDMFSHHPPFPFFVVSLFTESGAEKTADYHIFQVFFYLLVWTALFFSLKNKLLRWAVIICIVLTSMAYPLFRGHLILADNYLALALLILTINVIFIGNKDFSLQRELVFSSAVFAAVMSAFWGIPAVMILVLTKMSQQIVRMYRVHADREKTTIRFIFFILFRSLAKQRRLILIVIAPFCAIGLWMASNGSFSEFIDQSYFFNIDYYYRFVGKISFRTCCKNVENHFKDHLVLAVPTTESMREKRSYFKGSPVMMRRIKNMKMTGLFRLLIISNLLTMLFLFKENRKMDGTIFILYMACLIGLRGDLTLFHFSAYFIQSFFNTGFVLANFMKSVQKIAVTPVSVAFAIYLFLFVQPLNLVQKKFVSYIDYKPTKIENPSILTLIEWIVEPDETMYSIPFSSISYVETGRKPASRYIYFYPWVAMWEQKHEPVIMDLEVNRPPLIIFNPNAAIWRHKLIRYAPNLVEYVETRYEKLLPTVDELDDLWVLKSMRSVIHHRIESHVNHPIEWIMQDSQQNSKTKNNFICASKSPETGSIHAGSTLESGGSVFSER